MDNWIILYIDFKDLFYSECQTARVGQLSANHVVWAVEKSEFGIHGLL